MRKLCVFTDGGSRGNPGDAAIGIFIVEIVEKSDVMISNNSSNDVNSTIVYTQSSFIGRATNNTAEYEAVLQALQWLVGYVSNQSSNEKFFIEFFEDSLLVVEQIRGKYKVKQPHLQAYREKIMSKLSWLNEKNVLVNFSYIPREKNTQADALVNKAFDSALK